MKGERRKFGMVFAFAFLFATLAFVSVGCASGATHYVPDDYAKIQWAVDDASAGDTIIVMDGTYTENVDVNKRLTIRSENGSASTIVQAADSGDHGFKVTADYVNISGFTVKGTGGYGIYLSGAEYCNISNNTVSNNSGGIALLHDSNYNTITDNRATINLGWGIGLFTSSNNTIKNNIVSNNERSGIYLDGSSNNTLTNNTMSNNRYNLDIVGSQLSEFTQSIDITNKVNGKTVCYWVNRQDQEVPSDAGYVGIVNCKNILVKNLTLTNNGQGILLVYSNNSIIENTSISNNDHGIYLVGSSNNNIKHNIVSNNDNVGIVLEYSSNGNNIENNNVMSNGDGGLVLDDSSNNILYFNNFVDNTNNVIYFDSNIWNSTEKITYTYNGNTYTNYLGNYWDDYLGSDADGDGIGDTPYSIDGDNDSYPLMERFENYEKEPTTKFEIGDITKVTNTGDSGLRIHKDDPTGETVKVVPDEWTFSIIGGPQYDIQEHNWWEIEEEKYEPPLVKGWVAEDFLKEISPDDLGPSSHPAYFVSAQDKVEQAIEWAESKEGSSEWEGWCLKFVREAFKGEPIPGWTSAEAARQQLEQEGKFYSGVNCWNPPRGALVFLSALDEYQPYGHVGIYMGNQGVVHSYDKVRVDTKEGDVNKGIVIVERLTRIGSYIGWAYPPEEWLYITSPTCAIELRKNGIPIDNINVGEFFDIYVGDSTDDAGIKEVRFSSDDSQDGNPTGEWTDWYDWDTSSGDWNAVNKIKSWSFATAGDKEVWAEVKDGDGVTDTGSDNVYANQLPTAKPVITSPLEITPIKDIYYVGDTIIAEFTIKNEGSASITFDILTVGGRLNGACPIAGCPDFTHKSLTLQPGESYHYEGSLTLHPGNYQFFIAYYIENPTPDEKKLLDENNWNTCVDLGEGLADEDRRADISVSPINPAPSNLEVRATGELAETEWGVGVYHFLTWNYNYNFDNVKGFVIQEKFVTHPFIFLNPTEINWPYPIGFHEVATVGPSLRGHKIATPIPNINSAHTKEYRIATIFTDNLLSEWSNVATISPSTISPPSKLEATVSKDPLQIKLTWTDRSNNEMGFHVYRWEGLGIGPWFEQAGKEWPLLATVDANVETFIDTDVRSGYTFKYIIKAFNDVDISPPPNGVMVYIPALDEVPSPLTNSPPNILFANLKSPGELRIYDSQNRVTGLINGEIKEEIHDSIYDEHNEIVVVFSSTDTYRHEVVGTDGGTYGLDITSIDNGDATAFTATDIPTAAGATHEYAIDWAALSQGEEGVTVQVDSDGDGVFEHTFTSGDELTQDDFLSGTTPVPIPVFSPIGLLALIAILIIFLALAVRGGGMIKMSNKKP